MNAETVQFDQLKRILIQDVEASRSNTRLVGKIKISMKDPQKNRDLLNVQDCNKRLKHLIEASKDAGGFRKTQSLHYAHKAYQVRQQAQRILEVLACPCSCTSPHEPKLRMKPHVEKFDPQWNIWFELLLLHQDLAIHEISISVLEDSIGCSEQHKVTFKIDPIPQGSGQGSAASKDRAGWSQFREICEAVEKAQKSDCRSHLAIDCQQQLWEVDAAPRSSSSTLHGLINLGDCLERLSSQSQKRWLHQEKAILATILAYSLLQLHDSAWLKGWWSIQQIVFLYNEGTNLDSVKTSIKGFRLCKPYFSAPLKNDMPRSEFWGRHRNPCLFALGIILLELYNNAPLAFAAPTAPSQDIRIKVGDFLEDSYENHDMTREYYDAVRFCIYPDPNPESRQYTFDDKGFREKYFMEVVVPLEADLRTKVVSFQDHKFWETL